MKKFLIFLMILIPLVVIFIVNVTVNIIEGVVEIAVDNIVLDTEYHVANINESFKLHAEVYPTAATDKTIVWKSSDESIATVDEDGNVTFLNFGSVDISATSGNGIKSSSCHINITDVRVHSIEIYSDKTTLAVGDSTYVWASVVPSMAENQFYTLKSSNEEVLSLNNSGVALAKKVGTSIITATSEDGHYEASIAIDVVVPVEAIKIVNPEEKQITVSSSSFLINYEIMPFNATNKNVYFSSSQPEIASVSKSGFVEFKKEGSSVITVTTEDGNFSENVKIFYTGGYPTTIDLAEKEKNFDVSDGYKNYKINYSISPADSKILNITFVSNNPNVATVNGNGLVQVLSGGLATIAIKMQTAENTYIFESFLVNATENIKNISFNPKTIITPNDIFVLNPIITPTTATEKNLIQYEIISGSCAEINENVVNFNSTGTIVVKAFLNDEIYDTIEITYTGGYPTNLITNSSVEINVGITSMLEFSVYPMGCNKIFYRFEILESTPIIANNEVISLQTETGKFTALSSGTAKVRAYLKTSENEEIFKDYTISVKNPIRDFEIEVNEEVYENCYISALNDIEFGVNISPEDCVENEFIYSLSDNQIAKIVNNKVHFNGAGKVVLTITSKANTNLKKSVQLWYTSGYAVYATLDNFPQQIISGQTTFTTRLTNIIPQNAVNKSFSLICSNSEELNNSFNISYNADSSEATIIATGNGNSVISAVLSGSSSIIYSKNVDILQKVSNIEFLIPEGETPYSIIDLKCNVLPFNATNKNVTFELDPTCSNIAYIENDTLHFYNSENEKETAIVVAKLEDVDGEIVSKSITITSTFGKIIATDISAFSTNIGNTTKLDYSSEVMPEYVLDCDIVSGQNLVNVLVENSLITIESLKIGTVQIIVSLKDKNNNEIFKVLSNLTIQIECKIEDVNISNNNLSLYNDRYYTINDEIELNFLIEPELASFEQLSFELSDSSLATFNKNTKILKFNKNGLLELTVLSSDRNFVKKFLIQKTDSAVKIEYNLNNNFEINLLEEVSLNILKVYPSILNINFVECNEIVQSGETNKLEINKTSSEIKIKAINTGKTKLLVVLSDGSTATFDINCISTITGISFNDSEIITSEKTVTLKPVISPASTTDKKIVYSSSNTSIATVNEFGVITFVKAGTVAITACSFTNNNISATINVTSTFGEISSFELSSNRINLAVGESRLLTIASIFPQNATYPNFSYEIDFEQSNNNTNLKVVTLQNGLLLAQNGGYAIVSVSTQLSDGTILKKTCHVYVSQNLQSINFNLINNLSLYQNYYVTSLEEIEFQIIPTPIDASIEDVNFYVDNEDIATVENGRLIFKKEGIVKLSAFSNNALSSISIRHSKSPISFDLLVNEQPITNNIAINVNETLNFEAINIIPSDLSGDKIDIELLQNAPNRFGDLVCSVNSSSIMALHGGMAKYQISINGKAYKNNIQINVIQKASQIVCQEDIKTSNANYSINASIYPSDATNPTLKFEILSGSNIATISEIGEINFFSEGTIVVEISNEFSNVQKTIEITYSEALKTIEINDCPDYVFIGKTLQLSAEVSPANAQNEEIAWEVNNNLAQISSNGLLTPSKNEGEVIVCAYLKNYPDVRAYKTIEIYAIITDIYMDEDSKNDKVGIEGKRVFGTHNFSYNSENKYSNQFILGYQLTHNCSDLPKLDFVSSDTSIATIDENGIVTVLKPGQVTISIYPKKQISNDKNRFVFDSYTYNFVEGLNINSEKEFINWKNEAAKNEFNKFPFLHGCVFQSDVKLTYEKNESFSLRADLTLYGNGHLLDLNQNDHDERSLDLSSNTTLRNLNIRGYTFKENESIVNIQNYKSLVSTSINAKNIKLKFCNLQNARLLLSMRNASVEIDGCILENSSAAAIHLGSEGKQHQDNHLNINNCIFENCLNGCVSSIISKDSLVNNYLTIDGFMDMYNWQPVSLINKLGYSAMSFDAIQDYIKAGLKTYSYMLKEVDGEQYWHIGLFFIDCNISFEGLKYESQNTTTVVFNNTNNPYSLQKMKESIVIGDVTIYNYSLSGTTNYFIQPKTSYKDNTLAAYEKIRRSFKN